MQCSGHRPRTCYYATLLAIVILALQSVAADELENEINGFVSDRTITRVGHEFARHLTNFRNMRDMGDYNLTVHERPSARWGNMIWVERDHEKVFQVFLFPSTSNVKTVAERAADQIHEEVQRQKLRELFSDRHDLAEDEF